MPGVADHDTLVSGSSVTVAVNCAVVHVITFAVAGVTVTLGTGGELDDVHAASEAKSNLRDDFIVLQGTGLTWKTPLEKRSLTRRKTTSSSACYSCSGSRATAPGSPRRPRRPLRAAAPARRARARE